MEMMDYTKIPPPNGESPESGYWGYRVGNPGLVWIKRKADWKAIALKYAPIWVPVVLFLLGYIAL